MYLLLFVTGVEPSKAESWEEYKHDNDEQVTGGTRKKNADAEVESKIGARSQSKWHTSWKKAKHECRWYEMVL